jgi:hypothetical protein
MQQFDLHAVPALALQLHPDRLPLALGEQLPAAPRPAESLPLELLGSKEAIGGRTAASEHRR